MKDAKGHGSNPRGQHAMGVDSVGAHDLPRKVQGDKLEHGMANDILHDTNSHDRDFHSLTTDQVLKLGDYAKQFGFRKSATSSGSTTRAFHTHLSNRRDREIRQHNARLKKNYGY